MGQKKLSPDRVLTIRRLKALGLSNRKIGQLMHHSISTISKYTNARRKTNHWKQIPFNRKETPHFFPTSEEMDEVISAEMDKRVYLLFTRYQPAKPLSEYGNWKEIQYEIVAKWLESADPDGRWMSRLVNLRWLQLWDTAFS